MRILPAPAVMLGYIAGAASMWLLCHFFGIQAVGALLWQGAKCGGIVLLAVPAIFIACLVLFALLLILFVFLSLGWALLSVLFRSGRSYLMALFALIAIAGLVITIPMPKFAEVPTVYAPHVKQDRKPGCASCDEKKAERPDIIITGKPSGNDNPGWLSRWWGSWHMHDLLYLTPAQREDLHKLFHYKPALRTPASIPVPPPRDVVEQVKMAQQAAEADRLAAITEQRSRDIEAVKSMLGLGALSSEGTVRFTARIASTPEAKRLGIVALNYQGALALVNDHNKTVRQHNLSLKNKKERWREVLIHYSGDGTKDQQVFLVPILAEGKMPGWSLVYEFPKVGMAGNGHWAIVWNCVGWSFDHSN